MKKSFGKYAFYDSVNEISDLNFVRSDSYYISRQKRRLKINDGTNDSKIENNGKTEKRNNTLIFDTTVSKKSPSFSEVFGGSSKTATKSSRRDLSYRNKYKLISGIKVPARPIEPDNCCMSGCINCVWELFNEDLEEWKTKRVEAAQNLMKQNNRQDIEKWPKDWEEPPKTLDSKFIASQKHAEAIQKGSKVEEIQGMPVGLQVFALFEKKKKAQREHKNN